MGGMRLDTRYQITFLVNNRTNKILNLSKLGEGIALATRQDQIHIRLGIAKYPVQFKAKNTNGSFIFYLSPKEHEMIGLFGLSVNRLT